MPDYLRLLRALLGQEPQLFEGGGTSGEWKQPPAVLPTFRGMGQSGSWEPLDTLSVTNPMVANPPGGLPKTLGEWWKRSGTKQSLVDPLVSAETLPQDVLAGRVDPYSQKAIERSWDVAQTFGGLGLATAPMREAGQVGIFGGPLARTADMDAFGLAEEMAAAGAYPDDIYSATGWFQGADKQWKFEIPDEASQFVPPTTKPNLLQRALGEQPGAPLGDVLQHEELYQAYPELRNIETIPTGKAGGSYQPGYIRYGTTPRSTLLHESQHAVQDIEGFARGSSGSSGGLRPNTPAWKLYQEILQDVRTPMSREEFEAQQGAVQGTTIEGQAVADYPYETYLQQHEASMRDPNFARLLDRSAQETAVEQAYRRSAGEVEARNVQARRDFTPQRREELPPSYTQDVPSDKQIVQFKSKRGL